MISRDFVRRYLFTARLRHRVERLRKQTVKMASRRIWRF